MTTQIPVPQLADPPAEPREESLHDFKESLAYGSRHDSYFKFLKRLPAEENADFLRGLFKQIGNAIDDGGQRGMLDFLYEWNVRAYAEAAPGSGPFDYPDGPFVPFTKPLAEARIGLLSSSGHFVAGHDPEPFGVKHMTQAEAIPRIKEFTKAEPTLTAIPMDTPESELRVRHPGYDIRAAAADPNVALPLTRLREMVADGKIGELAPEAFSFVGATAQLPLRKSHAPAWAERLRAQAVDAVLLVPV